MSPFGLTFSQMILHTETSKLMYNWSFLFEVLHKPTLLHSTFKYIYCSLIKPGTTEKIFQEKESLYDVYIDNQNMRTHVATLKDMSKTNGMDREKFTRLNNQRANAVFNAQQQGVEPCPEDDDEIFAK